MKLENEALVRDQLAEFLEGGFAPNVILLREFDFKKAGIILDGLHFSAWILLGHIHARHNILLNFIKDPEKNTNVWPDAFWPENYQPENEQQWFSAIDDYDSDLQEMIREIKDPENAIFDLQANGKSFSWAALSALHHTTYHIGQLKTVGRQLEVW